jgi:hypothetical protein
MSHTPLCRGTMAPVGPLTVRGLPEPRPQETKVVFVLPGVLGIIAIAVAIDYLRRK